MPSVSPQMEIELTYAQAKKYLTPEELEAWQKCRYTYRCLVHYNKIFILYDTPKASEARVIGRVTVLDPTASRDEGIGFQVKVELKSGATYEVGVIQAPVPIYEDKVFMHVPFNVTAFYLPRHQHMVLQLPVVIKTEAKPWSNSGVKMLGLSAFKREFPEFQGAIL